MRTSAATADGTLLAWADVDVDILKAPRATARFEHTLQVTVRTPDGTLRKLYPEDHEVPTAQVALAWSSTPDLQGHWALAIGVGRHVRLLVFDGVSDEGVEAMSYTFMPHMGMDRIVHIALMRKADKWLFRLKWFDDRTKGIGYPMCGWERVVVTGYNHWQRGCDSDVDFWKKWATWTPTQKLIAQWDGGLLQVCSPVEHLERRAVSTTYQLPVDYNCNWLPAVWTALPSSALPSDLSSDLPSAPPQTSKWALASLESGSGAVVIGVVETFEKQQTTKSISMTVIESQLAITDADKLWWLNDEGWFAVGVQQVDYYVVYICRCLWPSDKQLPDVDVHDRHEYPGARHATPLAGTNLALFDDDDVVHVVDVMTSV
jgi:hypothetical protein